MSATIPTSSEERAGAANYRAQLRALIIRHFDESEIESMCFDLQVDYERLPGQGKDKKVIELLEHMARSGRLVELVDLCERQRPGLGWGDIRAAARATPEHFLPDLPQPDARGEASPRPVLNMPPERALRLGITVGALAVLVLLLVFSGGLIAGRFIRLTFEPIAGTPAAAQSAVDQILAAAEAPSGSPVSVAFTDLEATSLANAVLSDPAAPLSEVQLRFTGPAEAVVRARLASEGNREFVAAYTIAVVEGRLILRPEAAAMNMLGLPGSEFGWIALPVGFLQPATDTLQGVLDQTARSVRYEGVQVAVNSFRTWGVKK
jgi:hypothetical protein